MAESGVPFTAARARFAVPSSESPEQRREFAWRLWTRIDRDGSGEITRDELDCEEFHSVIRSIVAPESGGNMGGALYMRARTNMAQALQFCLRKADINADRSLTFREFESFLTVLRGPQSDDTTAELVFSLFDLDGDFHIDMNEFHELLRFFLAHEPTETQFREEWARLASEGEEKVTRQRYIRWLQTSTNPSFRAFAPPNVRRSASGGVAKPRSRSAAGVYSMKERPKWNKHFTPGLNPGHINDALPEGKRRYFSRPQSVPELARWCGNYIGCEKKQMQLSLPPPPKGTSALFPKILSSEGGTPLMMPERHNPGGIMRSHRTGEQAVWEEHWQVPARFKQRPRAGDRPIRSRAFFSEPAREKQPPPGHGRRRVEPWADGEEYKPARETTLTAESW